MMKKTAQNIIHEGSGSQQSKVRTFFKMKNGLNTVWNFTKHVGRSAWKPVAITLAAISAIWILNIAAATDIKSQTKDETKKDGYALVSGKDTTGTPVTEVGKIVDEKTAKLTWLEDGSAKLEDAKGNWVIYDQPILLQLANAKKINGTLGGRIVSYIIDGANVHTFTPFTRPGETSPSIRTTIKSGTIKTGEGSFYVGDDGAVFMSESAYLMITTNKEAQKTENFEGNMGNDIPPIDGYTITGNGKGIVIVTPPKWNGYTLKLDLIEISRQVMEPSEKTGSGN